MEPVVCKKQERSLQCISLCNKLLCKLSSKRMNQIAPICCTGRHYCHPKYRIARSCGSLPGQSSPAAAAGHREAKSSRRILPTELQLEPLLLKTLLVHSKCHGCYLSLYPATDIADISGATAPTAICNQLLLLQILLVHSICHGCYLSL